MRKLLLTLCNWLSLQMQHTNKLIDLIGRR